MYDTNLSQQYRKPIGQISFEDSFLCSSTFWLEGSNGSQKLYGRILLLGLFCAILVCQQIRQTASSNKRVSFLLALVPKKISKSRRRRPEKSGKVAVQSETALPSAERIEGGKLDPVHPRTRWRLHKRLQFPLRQLSRKQA